ncbi:MAG: Maf family protein [Gemmatimonadota bacterium]|nr:Maf family protein [Gemmatimonadota bacterium]MDE2866183.1 Maf family protein [Gemmatimonadota bacterium]
MTVRANPVRGRRAGTAEKTTSARGPVPVVLASASPRRADVLKMLGLSFEVAPARIEERREPGEAPLRYVERLAREKARAVSATRANSLTIAGDTIVVLDGRVLEKPTDREDAAGMLASLSGRVHSVYSGLALARGGRMASRVAKARVTFRSVGHDLIGSYVETGEPLDKAGGYGIQGYGSALVERIEGDYFTVVGLSVAAFVELLPELGLDYRPGKVFAP